MYGVWRQRRDRTSLHLLFGLFVLLPITVVFGHKGVAPWLLLAALPAFARGDFWQSAFGQLFDHSDISRPFFAGFTAILFYCFWIFLSGFWSPQHHFSLTLWVLAPVLVGGSVVWFSLHLSRSWAYRLSYAFAISIAAGMAVLLFEGLSGGFLRSIFPPADPSPDRSRDIIALGRGVSALAPALFPAAIIISFIWNRYAALALLFLGVIAAMSNDVSANAIFIFAGLAAGVAAFKAPNRIIQITGFGAIALLLLYPLTAFLPVNAIFEQWGGVAPPSWLHRVAIWQSVASRILEGLPFGFGADFARSWMETAPMITVPGVEAPVSVMPTHPHNIFLQTWLELGLPGVVSLALFFFFATRALTRANLPVAIKAALVSAVVVNIGLVMVDGSLWQVWRLAAMALSGMGVALAYSLHQHMSR